MVRRCLAMGARDRPSFADMAAELDARLTETAAAPGDPSSAPWPTASPQPPPPSPQPPPRSPGWQEPHPLLPHKPAAPGGPGRPGAGAAALAVPDAGEAAGGVVGLEGRPTGGGPHSVELITAISIGGSE
jgi:hypothetical protein